MTLDKLIRAVLKYMDGRGMLEDMKKAHRPPPGQKQAQKKRKR